MAYDELTQPREATRKRLPYLDNVKFFLIVCVVLGHAIKMGPTKYFDSARSMSVLIYSFHMPLFIFLSGLLLNRPRMTAQKIQTNVLLYLGYGYLAKLLRASVPLLVEGKWQFSLLSEGGLPWYMFALAAFYALAWILRKCDFMLVGILSVVLALACGYVGQVGEFLCLSRIVVFFPFFWLGHALSPQRVTEVFSRRFVRVASACMLILSAAACFALPGILYPYRSLFLGRWGYALCDVPNCMWVNRLFAYLASFVTGASVLGVVPQRRLPVASVCGSRTLWVYLLHHEVLDLLRYTGLPTWLVAYEWHWLVLVPLALVLAVVLALPIPVNPFARLRKDA